MTLTSPFIDSSYYFFYYCLILYKLRSDSVISNDDDDDDDDNDDQLCETAARAPLEPAHVHGNFYVLISIVEWHRLHGSDQTFTTCSCSHFTSPVYYINVEIHVIRMCTSRVMRLVDQNPGVVTVLYSNILISAWRFKCR